MIVDEITITIKAGNGGDGAVSYRREKFVARGGPDGGNGGQGGDIYFVGVSDLTALNQFRTLPTVEAQKGENGKSKKRFGKDAPALSIRIPTGTTITDTEKGYIWTIDKVGQIILIGKGGKGGRGNFEFRTATDKTPSFAEKGQPGQKRTLLLNLQFIADIGLIGLPNAGKSSLLNVLTHAHSKVGDYAFTTLEAHLGNIDGTIIADIPGLIEGAHVGRGLGTKFLKHIAKTKFLLHCIDAMSSDSIKNYNIVRKELEQYDKSLLRKPELVLLTKSDMASISRIQEQKRRLSELNTDILPVSILDDKSIGSLKKYLATI